MRETCGCREEQVARWSCGEGMLVVGLVGLFGLEGRREGKKGGWGRGTKRAFLRQVSTSGGRVVEIWGWVAETDASHCKGGF